MLFLSLLLSPVLAGSFNVLTFNVAGLPEILQSNDLSIDKTTSTQLIGTYFAQYQKELDVIHVQEDFNYHATLYAYDNHTYRTATSGGAAIGSGLNTVSNYDWVNFQRTGWNDCSDDSGSDCLTPKGFTSMKLLIEDNVYINFINLHADAGVEDGDQTARTSNIQQVVDFISANAIGEAVIVFGDTNSRYTRSADNINILSTDSGLTDAWVELVLGGTAPVAGSDALVCDNPSAITTCETVDKVFYRGSKFIDIKADAFDYIGELFEYEGEILSDHNPVLVNFTYTVSDDYKTSGLSGGDYGTYFNDIEAISTGVKASTLSFRGNERLDQVGLTLSDGTTFTHGGTGGDSFTLTLGSNEYWTSAELCTGTHSSELRNFYIKATTSAGNTVEAGTSTSDCETFTAPSGYQIVGFFGNNGDEVDQLGFIYTKQ